jgi:ribosome-associated protein
MCATKNPGIGPSDPVDPLEQDVEHREREDPEHDCEDVAGHGATVDPRPSRAHQDLDARCGDFVKMLAVGAREIAIAGDTIRLGQLLKLAGIAESGGEAKALLADGVRVNGEREARRGRQLHPGDLVAAAGETLRVVAR